MAARRHAWDGEINELPAEILSYDVNVVPRSTLKDIANRLNADTISAGNWESLAEKLGFVHNIVLDNLAQKAKVENTYPGLLMLQEWSRRSGSTAHVLLHALREIQREDCVGVLVSKLFEMHTMQLLVSVQDEEGPVKFLRVPTQKSAPLHASLYNTLMKPPYWYDIVGPRYDIDWNTPSGELQGTQLSLRVRTEPSQNSMNEIYGTAATPHQSPHGAPLEMNIPPEKPTQQSAFPERNGTSMLNQLSRPRLDGTSQSQPAPQCCNPQAPAVVSQVSAMHDQSPESELFSFQPMTNIRPLLHSDRLPQQQQFPNFATLMSSASDFHFSAPPVSMSSLQDSGDSMEYNPSSETGLKEPLQRPVPREHDEMLLKEPFRPVGEKMNIAAVAFKEDSLHEDQNTGVTEHSSGVPLANIGQLPVIATSFMHPVYVSHDSVIQFCNNPTSPQSMGSNPTSLDSTEEACVKPRFTLDLKSADPCVTAQQDSPSPDGFRMISPGDYVPLGFIEQHSRSSEKSSRSSSLNEEENMQTDYPESEYVTAEGVNNFRHSGSRQEPDTYGKFSTIATTSAGYCNMDSSKPKPCTYTMYRPDMASNSRQCERSSHPHPVPHSVSLDHGYLDMRAGLPTTTSHHHPKHSASAMMAGIHSSTSMDSYMNTAMSPDLSVGADFLSGRNLSAPNLAHLLHSRSRTPLPAGGGDMFQPRDRRPLTQDHELLLDDPEPEYTYIDAVSAASQVCRSSERAVPSVAEGRCGTDRSRTYRSSDSVPRRSSDMKADHMGSVSPAELERVPGWNANITEGTIAEEMSRYINDDGNFIVWRYTTGRKYVISVSHLRSIRHYAVYESEREGKITYYIFPKGARFNSLLSLVLHCQKRGVAEPTKTFKTPDGKQTHQSSGSNRRFSHVHLKCPIPARRN